MKTILLFLSVFLSASFFGQNVYIPDANFKAYLVVNFDINTNEDNEIQVSEASAFDWLINCNDLGISDLTGVEAFTALTGLQCSYNQLTSLDVAQNILLRKLMCNTNNQLTCLNVGNSFQIANILGQDTEIWAIDNPNLTCIEVDESC